MTDLLERKFFPFVIKPGRYAGGEPGQIVKNPDGKVSYLHIYPDKYELGHSYPGLQILYHVINSDERFVLERAFALDRDAETLMRREQIPLFSLETRRPAASFDAIGFTLVDETVYTNVLAMIDLAGLPLRSRDRTDSQPIIMAGGPAAFNPEPLAPFVDLFFIGDAEEGLIELLAILGELRGIPRAEKLRQIAARVESAYVPALYSDDRLPIQESSPARIKARVITELKGRFYPEQPIVPLIETVHNHLGIEIMRGCPQGCRFCMAGSIYRPVRVRPAAEIVRQVEEQIAHSGYDDVSLLALSSTDYPDLESLATLLARRLEPQRVAVALPSLRPGSVTPALLDAVKRVRKSGLTVAPEAGTERLRLFIRKDFPDAAVYDTARLAFEKGWHTIKLYFMIGLPTETNEDLEGIAAMCREICRIGQGYPARKTINVTLSPFIPKAHTPFQWDEMVGEEAIEQKIAYIKRHTRLGQVSFKINSPRLAILSTLLGRGGRGIADVIETAYRKGCRFDGWREELDFGKWMESFCEHDVEPETLLRAIPFSQPLPWSHIEKGQSVEHLMAERQRTSGQLREFVPHFVAPETVEQPEPAADFGRGKKKVPSRNVAAPTKNRVRIHWGKTARYRYMSHLDNLRLIERSIRRSRIPVSFSQGFNPTMKLSFGPPLPLGYTSEAEYVDITLEVNMTSTMIDDFRKTLPEGINMYDARVVLGKNASLSSALNRVVYTVPTSSWPDRTKLEERMTHCLNADTLPIEREGKSEKKTVDLKPALYELRIEGDQVVIVLGIGEGGYARPDELARFLCQETGVAVESLHIHRKAIYRLEADGRKTDAMDL